ncbi:hypothetical protein EMIT0158MI4_120225 [Burkholderia ambifaria]
MCLTGRRERDRRVCLATAVSMLLDERLF